MVTRMLTLPEQVSKPQPLDLEHGTTTGQPDKHSQDVFAGYVQAAAQGDVYERAARRVRSRPGGFISADLALQLAAPDQD